jgi:formate dehydrogenase subunit gamma
VTAARQPWSTAAARRLLASIDDPAPVLVALQELQLEFGFVHPDAVPLVAEAFTVSRADVFGVLTFYRDLRTAPPAAVEVRVCMGEACQAVGARVLRSSVDDLAGADCAVSAVYCMGNCALGPTAVVNGRLIGRASAARLRADVEEARGRA